MFELPSSRTSCTRLPQEKFLPNSRLFKEALTFLHFEKEQQEQKQTSPGSSNADSKDKPAAPLTQAGMGMFKARYPSINRLSVVGMSIVPVKVKAKGRNQGMQTYAFLDSGPFTQPCKWRTNKLNAHWLT